ncbi:MAG: NAD(P)/FAD-dependent oxidoreductase, partial [Oscillospiraceae bacterium]|nr:NAD(P)/FAD-dependent oxidoreductase [Oscillospiraceae bacterium]
KKLNITGKGRCNVTNNCSFSELMENVPQNPRFMYSAFSSFSPQDMMSFLEGEGVALKTERGSRVFPVSDRARDITDALFGFAKKNGVKMIKAAVSEILFEDGGVSGVIAENKRYLCDSVIVATGGASYPATGSTGDGYRFAEEAGHTVVKPRASLVALCAEQKLCKSAQGLTLKNVTLSAYDGKGRLLFSELGEMLFTHFGISGPLVLSASAHMRDFEKEKYYICIDLKPGLSEEKLEERILRDIEEKKNKDMINLLRGLLPSGMIPIVLEKSGISGDVKGNSLTRERRKSLRETLKSLRIDIDGPRPIDEAIITSGGVSVREINPKTMESKKMRGLFFAGEVLDVDAYTGGFNLQIAWSSAYAAGRYAAGSEE